VLPLKYVRYFQTKIKFHRFVALYIRRAYRRLKVRKDTAMVIEASLRASMSVLEGIF
jgi:hypothetical protein